MTNNIEKEIREICTYHADEGTSGYLLSEEQFQKLFKFVTLAREEGRREGESEGIIRTLKWVMFLQTYKHKDLIKEEMEKFIESEEKRFPELKDLERY